MAIVRSKTFKCGDGVAVCLPKEVAFAPGIAVTVEHSGEILTIRPAKDPVEEKRKVLELVERLRALSHPAEIQQREPIEFPDRPALY